MLIKSFQTDKRSLLATLFPSAELPKKGKLPISGSQLCNEKKDQCAARAALSYSCSATFKVIS